MKRLHVLQVVESTNDNAYNYNGQFHLQVEYFANAGDITKMSNKSSLRKKVDNKSKKHTPKKVHCNRRGGCQKLGRTPQSCS